MKKIKKEFNKILKAFLALGLLFNNLMPLSVVFALEDGENTEIVDKVNDDVTPTLDDTTEKNDDEVVQPTNDDTTNNENINNDNPTTGDTTETNDDNTQSTDGTTGSGTGENVTPTTGDGTGEDKTNQDATAELKFTASLTEDDQIIIKYNKALELSEQSEFTIIEDFKYLDQSTSGGEEIKIELTEDVKNALVSDDGYIVPSVILKDNLYAGEYSANVKINDNEVLVNKLVAADGEGIEFKLYDANETLIEPEDGIYYIDKDSSSFIVTAKLLNGGISPNDKVTIGEEEFMAYELFTEGAIAEETLEGYLYGAFDYSLSLDYTLSGEEKNVSKSYTIMYGAYQYNTDNLNESAKNVDLSSKYYFYGDYEENSFYRLGEDGIEDILKDFVGDSKIITYVVSDDDGLIITLTDGRVTVTYYEATLDEYGKIAARIENDNEEVSSGDTFTVKYIVNIDEYYMNGFSGLVKYDEELLKLISMEASEYEGGNKDGQSLYAGDKTLLPEIEVDDEDNVTIIPKDYVLLTLTFEAIKAGSANITIEDAKFYNMYLYFESEDEISTSIIINEATDNSLASLKVNGQELALEEDQLEYEITVSKDVTDAEIEALVNNQTAKVTSISGPETLADGENIYTIVVTAENGNEKVYTVKVIREASEEKKVEEPVANLVSYVNDDTNEPEPVVTTPTKPATDSTDTKVDNTDTDTPKEKGSNLSRVVIIILILLVIAGLIYLIFKDDDKEEKQANKDINRMKKENIDSESPKVNNKDKNRNNNNNKNYKNNKKRR